MFQLSQAFAVVCLITVAALVTWQYLLSIRQKGTALLAEQRDAFDAPVQAIVDLDIASTSPHPYRPWKPGKFQLTMGLRKMVAEQWLVVDNCYLPEQQLRRELLTHHREGVMQYLPGSELACEEILDLIVDFLSKRYPQHFVRSVEKPDYLTNRITGFTFRVTKPYEIHPLEVAAQLVMEDINLLMKGDGSDDKHYLKASYAMGPAGWDLQERIGWPLWRIHSPVPTWNVKLLKSVEKFFYNIKVSSPMERINFFVQTTDTMFQQTPFEASLPNPPAPEDIRLRYERQTFRRLPRSGAVCFMVRTFLIPMTDLANEPGSLRDLILACRALPPDMAKYKARQVWIDTMETYCERVLGENFPLVEPVVDLEHKIDVEHGPGP